MMVIMLHPPPPTLHQAVTAQASKHSPDMGYRLDFGDSQEWVLEAEGEGEGEEYSFLDGLPPFISLQEDQLLVVVASPRARRNQSQGRRHGSYQLIKHMSRRPDEEASERDWRTEEDGEESEEEALTPLGLDPDGLNKPLSARLPLRRVLPEARHPLCLQQHPPSGLPTASVILGFHDEAWPTLLRTVHSILDTAPRALLQEIILVDDLSQQEPLKSALSEYVAKLEAVKLLRSNKRLGTIGARMLGATRATGDVLVFMDARCECHPGWLEPLLSRIADDSSFQEPSGVSSHRRDRLEDTSVLCIQAAARGAGLEAGFPMGAPEGAGAEGPPIPHQPCQEPCGTPRGGGCGQTLLPKHRSL